MMRDQDLSDFVSSASTHRMRQRRVSALHAFYGFALDQGAIQADPSRKVYVRRAERVPTWNLLQSIGCANDKITWHDLISDALRTRKYRWASENGKETLRRMLAHLRQCRNEQDLLRALRRSAVEQKHK